MIQHKLELLDLLDDIISELDVQGMEAVTFKDIIDYVYRNRKDVQTEDSITKLLLTRYLSELKEYKNETNEI